MLENVLVGCHSRFRAGLAKTLFRMPGFRREERAAQAEARQLLGIVGLSDFADEQVRNPQDFEPPVARHPAGRNYRYGARTKPTLVADRKFELLALRRGRRRRLQS